MAWFLAGSGRWRAVVTGYLRIQAESRNGLCVLRVSGELDLITAGEFAERADAAVQAVPGPVLVDLSCLTFLDAHGARVLAAVAQGLPGGRRAAVRSCPPHVRLVLDMLGLSLNYLPADYLSAHDWDTRQSGTHDLVNRVQDARVHAIMAKLRTRSVLSRLADTSIRLAGTRERTELIRDQGQRILSRTRADRELVTRSRQKTAS